MYVFSPPKSLLSILAFNALKFGLNINYIKEIMFGIKIVSENVKVEILLHFLGVRDKENKEN